MKILFALLLSAAAGAAESAAVIKFLSLFQQLNEAQSSKQKVRFRFTESEVNEYLHYAQQKTPRPGIDRLSVKFFPANYISTYTVIDFDMVERLRPGTVPLVMKPFLNGQKAVWIDLRINAQGGAATFSVEKAYFESIRIPAFVVEKVINAVGSRQREGWDTSKPVPLPFALRSITTEAQMVSGEN